MICHKITGSQPGNPGTVARARESKHCGQVWKACQEHLLNWNLKGKNKLLWPVGPNGGLATRTKCKDVNENLLDIQGDQSRGRHIAS